MGPASKEVKVATSRDALLKTTAGPTYRSLENEPNPPLLGETMLHLDSQDQHTSQPVAANTTDPMLAPNSIPSKNTEERFANGTNQVVNHSNQQANYPNERLVLPAAVQSNKPPQTLPGQAATAAATTTKSPVIISSTTSIQQFNDIDKKKSLPDRLCRWAKILLIIIGVLLLLAFIILYVVIPASFYWSSQVRRLILFLAFTGGSTGLSDPESYGLNCSRNIFISSDNGIRLGAWYVQSHASPCAPSGPMFHGDSKTVLYIHGIGRNRRAKNRIKIMQVLSSEVKLHTVSFDYRGFGDSTDLTPSREGVINDTLAVYRDILKNVPREKIVVWGHSLGTSVAMYLLSELHKVNESPSALILEAALDDIGTISKVTTRGKIWRWMPCYDAWVADRFMSDPATNFNSTEQADKIDRSVPVLMLHAQDDPVVPYKDGCILRDALVSARNHNPDGGPVALISFKESLHYGHNLIPFYPGLGGIIERFLNDSHSFPPNGPPL